MARDVQGIFEIDYTFKLPAKTDYGIGVIGCGEIMNNAHLPAYRDFGFRVVACCDIREEAAKNTAQKFKVQKWFTYYRRMLELQEIEIVDIAIHPKDRVQIVQDCAKAGKHILIQKPFANNLDDALAMVEACEKAGVKLMVNQQARYAPGHRFTKLLIERGWLGEVYHLTHHVRDNQDFSWYVNSPNFLIVDHGIHYIDLMRYWLGYEPKSVYATTVRMPGQKAISPMVYSINLEFNEQLMANLWFNDVVQGKNRQFYQFIVEGTEGAIIGNPTQVNIALKESTEPFIKLDLKGTWFHDAFAGSMGELMRAIQQNDEPEVSGRDNINSLRIALSAVQSSQEHCPVNL